jgi:hypothetical protein
VAIGKVYGARYPACTHMGEKLNIVIVNPKWLLIRARKTTEPQGSNIQP